MSLPMSSPSASDASRSVAATSGWSPQASSMPTDCEPCPGKTKANGFMDFGYGLNGTACTPPGCQHLEIEQHGAPREAPANALEHQCVALVDLPPAHSCIQGERDRRGRR